MKNYIITLDTGTTNTRAVLWSRDGHVLGEIKCEAGVRDTAVDGSSRRLKEKIRDCLQELAAGAGIDFGEVEGVFASGMISSNVGILEVPHLLAPASLADFAENVQKEDIPELCPAPVYFIRGLKNNLKHWKNFHKMDMMRGEEAETLALLEEYPPGIPYIFILPGSHTKFVFVNERQEITGCLTSLTGELLDAVTRHTILADAVERRFASPDTYSKDAVLAGYRAAGEQGFGRAAFLTRIHKMFGDEEQRSAVWCAGFLLGTVLWNDAAALRGACPAGEAEKTVGIVAGKEPFLSGLSDVLEADGYLMKVVKRSPAAGPSLAARGAFAVAKYCLERS